jgi:hypothetical protein
MFLRRSESRQPFLEANDFVVERPDRQNRARYLDAMRTGNTAPVGT